MTWRRAIAAKICPEMASEAYRVVHEYAEAKRRFDQMRQECSGLTDRAYLLAEMHRLAIDEAKSVRSGFERAGLRKAWNDCINITDVEQFVFSLDDESLEKLKRYLRRTA